MAKVNITQAAKLAGITRQYFHKKYVTTGKITVEKDADGKNPHIDTAEILRVFGNKGVNSDDGNSHHQMTLGKDSKITELEAEVRLLRELFKAKDDHISDLQQALKRLEHRPVEPRRGFWSRVFGA